MCGIAGLFLSDHVMDGARAEATVRRMIDIITHRGPDSAAVKIIPDQNSLVALGHRRLAIVDLSAAGHQPMASKDGRFTIIYNGETYGLEALRQALLDDGYVFRGHSDTEIMLEYIARWGVERALPLFEGMFAFALWDSRDKVLTLARDRAGIKPLYWMKRGGVFGFASELKALMPLFEKTRPPVSARGKLLYAQNGYVPAPYTIYEDVFKLSPGHFLTIRAGSCEPEVTPYWVWGDQPALDDGRNWSDEAHDVLSESVRITLAADVPVGCFLSGGIDSSLVTALMQSHCSRPVKTFAIGFEEQAFNEAPYAKAVAQHLGTDHTELIVSEADMLNVLPLIGDMYDEPFADSSQIPTYLVSKLAREQVTVSLSGDGGDELFSGYSRYQYGLRSAAIATVMPRGVRRFLGNNLPGMRGVIGGPSRASSYMRLLGSTDFDELYNNFLSYDTPLQGPQERAAREFVRSRSQGVPMNASQNDKIRAMRRIDFSQYMTDDVLTKVDRASMAASLESRVPLLNQRVIDLACRLPVSSLTDGVTGKMILRDVLARYVPRALFERPKMGFGVPMGAWIRGPLKDMVTTNIEAALQAGAPFDTARTRRALDSHMRGTHDHSYILWLISTYGGWASR